MTMRSRALVLSPLAEDDLSNIASWTASHFGARQAGIYVDALVETIEELVSVKTHPPSKDRNEILPGLRSLHMARRGRSGRHILLYFEDVATVTILRIVHDSMELARHLPPETGE